MNGWSSELVLDPSQKLYRLAAVIDWAALEAEFGKLFCPDNGRPGVPIRLRAGLHLLKHTYALSDQEVVRHWVQNSYDQYFCGERYFQHKLPINPSQMTKWRQRIGEAGCEKLLQISIEAGKRTKTITERSFEKVIVDTTVQPEAVAHPTDARLFRKIHAAMIRIAKSERLELRQSFTRTVRNAFTQPARYAKAKQFKRARKVQKHLKILAGRVLRDVERKLSDEGYGKHRGTLVRSELLLTQKRKTKNKLYACMRPKSSASRRGRHTGLTTIRQKRSGWRIGRNRPSRLPPEGRGPGGQVSSARR